MAGLSDMKLRPKLIMMFLIAGIIPLAGVGFLAARLSTKALNKNAQNQLAAVRGIKKATIETYFSERKGDMGVLNETVNTLRDEAIAKLVSNRDNKKAQI